MYETELQAIEAAIRDYCRERGLPPLETIPWTPLPFSGEWGLATSFFQLAAQESRQRGKEVGGQPVAQRAQEIATEIAARLGTPPRF